MKNDICDFCLTETTCSVNYDHSRRGAAVLLKIWNGGFPGVSFVRPVSGFCFHLLSSPQSLALR